MDRCGGNLYPSHAPFFCYLLRANYVSILIEMFAMYALKINTTPGDKFKLIICGNLLS